jgi:chemotaxis protein methyltransferase CheR
MSTSPARTVHAGSVRPESALRILLKRWKYKFVVRFSKRKNKVYTQFNRFPTQYQALAEKVVPFLRPDGAGSSRLPLEVIMFGCCSGAEAFSLAWFLRKNAPGLPFRIRGFDIVAEVITQAQTAVFTREEVYSGPFVTDDFVAEVFDPHGDDFKVKPEIAAHVTCSVGSILDAALIDSLGRVEMVFAQNMLFHLPPPQARVAFDYLIRLLAPRSALFVNGMDVDMRIELTERARLEPLDHRVEAIHEDARVNRGSSWASTYWGREPFSAAAKDWLRRYGTIYLKGTS